MTDLLELYVKNSTRYCLLSISLYNNSSIRRTNSSDLYVKFFTDSIYYRVVFSNIFCCTRTPHCCNCYIFYSQLAVH